jgi:uncharacterized protein
VSTPTEAIRENAMANNEEFRRLQKEHAVYATQLDNLLAKPFLSENDKVEEVRLKKLKLRLKDQMASMLHKARLHN